MRVPNTAHNVVRAGFRARRAPPEDHTTNSRRRATAVVVHRVQVRDVMDRTRRNLDVIDKLKAKNEEVWEITQLVNSFAGIVLHPWEEWEKEFRAIPFDTPQGLQWPRLESMDPDDDPVTTVGDQIRLVRNAFAHGNISFEAEGDGEISSIVIWNTDFEGYRTWSARVHRDTLKRFLDTMIEQTERFPEPKRKDPPLHKKYAKKQKNPQCPACGRTVKRGHPLYPSLVLTMDLEVNATS